MFSLKVGILQIFFLVIIAGCKNSSPSITQSINFQVTRETTPPTPISSRSEEYIWPNSSIINITDKNITIEVIMYERETCLRIDVTAYGFEWPNLSMDNHIVRDIKYFDESATNPLSIIEVGKGGGGGGKWLEAQTNEMFLYDVKTKPMPNYITAIISFDNIFGLIQPARFTLKPTNRPNMQCPQLPATTPEG
jgi:hypothetical protein